MCNGCDVHNVYTSHLCRFFTKLAKPVPWYMKYTWMVMWKWVGPIVMFVIFFASIILQLIDPLKYTVYLNVRIWGRGVGGGGT